MKKWRNKDGKGEEKLCYLDLNYYFEWWEGGMRDIVLVLDFRNLGVIVLLFIVKIFEGVN